MVYVDPNVRDEVIMQRLPQSFVKGSLKQRDGILVFCSGEIYKAPEFKVVEVIDKNDRKKKKIKVANFKMRSLKVSKSLAYFFGVPETVEFTDKKHFTYFEVETWGLTAEYLEKSSYAVGDKIEIRQGYLKAKPNAIGGKVYPNFNINAKHIGAGYPAIALAKLSNNFKKALKEIEILKQRSGL